MCRLVVDGQVTDVLADGHKTRTVALELEDAVRLIATVREMGWVAFPISVIHEA